MTIATYEAAREAFALAGINWQTDTIDIHLLDLADYTPNIITDRVFADVPTDAIVSTATLANKTATNGELKCDDVTFTSVVGDSVEAFLIVKNTGDANTSPLILFNDGKIYVNCAAAVSVGATTIRVDPLELPIKTGDTVLFTGGVTVTLTANAAAGARAIQVEALQAGESIAVGESGTAYIGGKLQFVPNSGNAELSFGGNYVVKI